MPAIETAIAQLDALLASLKTRAAGDNASPVADGSSSKPAASPPSKEDEELFKKAKLVVGRIVSVDDHPTGSDKLWVMRVDVGGEEKGVCAGLKKYYPREELQGRVVVVVLNLKEAKLGGVPSEAMILAANTANEAAPDGRTVRVLDPPSRSEPGDLVALEGAAPAAEWPKVCKQWKNIVEKLAAQGGRACFAGWPLATPKGRVTVPPEIADGSSIQ